MLTRNNLHPGTGSKNLVCRLLLPTTERPSRLPGYEIFCLTHQTFTTNTKANLALYVKTIESLSRIDKCPSLGMNSRVRHLRETITSERDGYVCLRFR